MLVIAAFSVYFAWSIALPQVLAPDEYMRFDLPLFIASEGYLPSGWEEAIRNKIWGYSYGFTAYGSSLLSALFIWMASLVTNDIETLLIASRFANVILATATVYLCILIGRQLFSSSSAPYLFATFVGFLPQFAFLASYTNADSSGIFATALICLFLIYGVKTHWTIKSIVGLGISLGICALTYYFAYGAIVISVLVYFADNIHNDFAKGRLSVKPESPSEPKIVRPRTRFVRYVLVPCGVFFIAFAICGWFFIRNWIIYDGDFLGMRSMYECGELFAMDEFKPSNHVTPRSLGYSPLEMIFGQLEEFSETPWLTTSVKSFIGVFGYMAIQLPRCLYCAYCVLMVIGLVFGVIALVERRRDANAHSLLLLAACLVAILISFILSAYYSWNTDYQPQGRYLICAIIPLGVLFSTGYSHLSGVISRKASARFESMEAHGHRLLASQDLLNAVMICIWIVMFAIVAFSTIIPEATGPLFNQTSDCTEYVSHYVNAH